MRIYKITNRINGKVYIGQTTRSIAIRWKQHCTPSKHCCRLIYRAIQKYGKENFTVEQIDHAHSRDELNSKEQYWIQFYDSMNREKGYNLTSGGDHPVFSDETKVKISRALIGKVVSEETRAKLSKAHKGKVLSEETCKKLRELSKGRKHSEDTKAKIRCLLNGHIVSYETRVKMSNIRKGSKQSKETIAKRCEKTRKPVICVETGEVFDCAKTAAKQNRLKSVTGISMCCRDVNKTSGGKHWRYYNECVG